MKLKFIFNCIFVIATLNGFTQKFDINPYLKALTNIKDGYFEGGVELHNDKLNFSLLPYVRLPLTNKSENLLVLDRFTNTWRGIVAFKWEKDLTTITSNTNVHGVSAQIEWGRSEFKYYPTGSKANEQKSNGNSFAAEAIYSYYNALREHIPGMQKSIQVRVRYSDEMKASKEVGVVIPSNNGGITTTSSMIIAPPSSTPNFSPAFAFQKYRGSGNLSFTHALYYDMQGSKNNNNPFNNLHRMRYEFWAFYYPIIPNNPNVKIGFGPFLSLRTRGSDDFNKIEYGGQTTVKVGSLFQSFF